MGCITLSGIGQSCTPAMGGINTVILYDSSVDSTYTFDILLEGGEDLNVQNLKDAHFAYLDSVPTYNASYMAVYTPAEESSTLSAETTADKANGIYFTQNTLSLVFNELSETNVVEFNNLTTMKRSDHIRGFVRNNNKKWFMIGACSGLTSDTGSGNQGTAKTDGNTINVTLLDAGPYIYTPMDSDACAYLDAVVTAAGHPL